MASRSDIEAGKAFVTLYAKTSPLVQGLQAANAMMRSWGASMMKIGVSIATAGAAAMAPFALATKHFIETGDALAKMSQRTGVSVESLSELGYAAGQSGTDLATLEKSIRHMQKTLGDSGESPEAQFMRLAAEISAIEDPSARAATAMKTFGKNGVQLLPMLADGADGIRKLREEAQRLGGTKSTESATLAVNLGDAIDRGMTAAKAAIYDVGAALAPVLLPLADAITDIVAGVAKWVKANGELIRVAAAAAASVVGIGVGIAAIGAALFGASVAISALMTPMGLLTAAVIGVGVAAWKMSKTFRDALGAIGSDFAGMFDMIKQSWGAIVSAVRAGDLTGAFKIVVAAGNLAWKQLVLMFQETWQPIRQWFLSMWNDISFGLVAAMLKAFYAVEKGVTAMAFAFRDAWLAASVAVVGSILSAAETAADSGLLGAGASAGIKGYVKVARKLAQKGQAVSQAQLDKEAAQAKEDILQREAGAMFALSQNAANAERDAMRSGKGSIDAARKAAEDAADEWINAVAFADQAAANEGGAGRKGDEEGQRAIKSAAVATTASALLALGGSRTPQQLQAAANKKLDKLIALDEAMLKQQKAANLQFVA